MHQDRGIVYACFGDAALSEMEQSVQALSSRNRYHITALSWQPEAMSLAQAARWAKINIDNLSPYRYTLYLDADTRPFGDLAAGFEILESGFDLVLAPSTMQGEDLLWHVGEEERAATLEELGYPPLQLQAGVMWIRSGPTITRLFSHWRSEWLRWKGEDQAALLRALAQVPVKVWMLGYPWNSSTGAVISHLCGRVRRMQ